MIIAVANNKGGVCKTTLAVHLGTFLARQGRRVVLVDLDRASVDVALIIIGREIAISALREWMARLGRSGKVAVSFIGKLKTTAQMIAILLLLYHDPIGDWQYTPIIGRGLLYLAAFLTLWSMLHYLLMAWKALRNAPAS